MTESYFPTTYQKRPNPFHNKGIRAINYVSHVKEMKLKASQEGFEPPTTRLEGECSIQLSYWDIIKR
jgi:hypothetical protein